MFVVHEDPLHKLAEQSLLRGLCSLWLLLEPCEMLCFPLQDLTSHAVAEGGGCVEEEGKVHHLSSSRAHPMVQKSIWAHRAVPSMEASQHVTILLLLLLLLSVIFFVIILQTPLGTVSFALTIGPTSHAVCLSSLRR